MKKTSRRRPQGYKRPGGSSPSPARRELLRLLPHPPLCRGSDKHTPTLSYPTLSYPSLPTYIRTYLPTRYSRLFLSSAQSTLHLHLRSGTSCEPERVIQPRNLSTNQTILDLLLFLFLRPLPLPSPIKLAHGSYDGFRPLIRLCSAAFLPFGLSIYDGWGSTHMHRVPCTCEVSSRESRSTGTSLLGAAGGECLELLLSH